MTRGITHFFDSDRLISSGGGVDGATVYFYYTGTTNLAPIYSDIGLTTPMTNPVVVAAGSILPAIYLDPSIVYRRRLVHSLDSSVFDKDPIYSSSITAGTVLWQNAGSGSVSTTVDVALKNLPIHLSDYFSGTLGATSNITSALQSAVAAASSRVSSFGGQAEVLIPAGYYFTLTATVVVPTGVTIRGAGKTKTYLRRTGNYGNTFEVGTANPAANVECAGISDMTIFHDHGAATVAPTNPLNWVNAVTGTPAHIIAYTPVSCKFENLNLCMLPFQFICEGGSYSIFRNITTYGVYDDANTNMQEGLAGFLMAGETAVTGSIPTWHVIDQCQFGGFTRPSTVVTYYGANTKTTTKNCGPQNGLVIWMAENLSITNSYTGACNSNGILISGKSTDIIAGVFIAEHFFDPCGVKYQDAGLKFENRDVGAVVDGITVTAPQFKGQGNGWRAISDWGNTATNGSVKDLVVVGGHASVFVGNPVELYNVRRAYINMNISAYNSENFYGVGSTESCGVHVAAGCVNVTIDGYLGGGIYGETAAGANNRCRDGVRADDWINSRVTVKALDAGLSGSLFVGPPADIAISTLDANFTLTYQGSSPVINHTGTLTANRVVTLSTTNAVTGIKFRVARSGGGAFTLTVSGKALSTNQWAEFEYLTGTGWILTGSGTL